MSQAGLASSSANSDCSDWMLGSLPPSLSCSASWELSGSRRWPRGQLRETPAWPELPPQMVWKCVWVFSLAKPCVCESRCYSDCTKASEHLITQRKREKENWYSIVANILCGDIVSIHGRQVLIFSGREFWFGIVSIVHYFSGNYNNNSINKYIISTTTSLSRMCTVKCNTQRIAIIWYPCLGTVIISWGHWWLPSLENMIVE